MPVTLHLLVMFVFDIFKSRRRLEAENLFLRHQLNIALRLAPLGLRLHGSDRALLVRMTQIWPSLLDIFTEQTPEIDFCFRCECGGWTACTNSAL
jgi:hypothetical protein